MYHQNSFSIIDAFSLHFLYYLIAKNYNFELAKISCTSFADKVTISEVEISDQFKQNPDLYKVSEQRYVKQIFANSEEKINTLYQNLENGISFNEVAINNNMKKKDIELGLYSEKQLYKDFAKIIFTLEPNSYSKPIKGPFNWHIFTVSKINSAQQKSFSAVKKEIKSALIK